jgi:N-acetyl-anhydromuramyl-L-alanine amidase AmpD
MPRGFLEFAQPPLGVIALVARRCDTDRMAKSVVTRKDGSRWLASVDGGAEIVLGNDVKYGSHRGLQTAGTPNPRYAANDFTSFGFWSHFIEPTAVCESGRSFLCLNTYDSARFTFGFVQFAAHVPNGDFVLYLRRLVALGAHADYFPDLALVNNRVARVEADSIEQLETNDSTKALQAYLNPDAALVDDAEADKAARFIHWTTNDPDARLAQVSIAIESWRKALVGYAKAYGLDGKSDVLCCVVADIRHQGRGKSDEIKAALASEDPYEALLAIGASAYPVRVQTLRKEIDARVAAGVFGHRKYSLATKDFVDDAAHVSEGTAPSMPTLRLGHSGTEVATWQSVLAEGAKPAAWGDRAWPLAIDGVFGEATKLATEAWQAEHGLEVDGIVGPRTWEAAGALSEDRPGPLEVEQTTAYEVIPARNFQRGRKQPVRLVVIHTMENPEGKNAARNNSNWFKTQPAGGTLVDKFARPDPNGTPFKPTSAHYNVDAYEIIQSVLEPDTAFHAKQVNDFSIGIEHGGRAAQTAQQWADDFSKRMLERSAALTAEICARYRIPPVQLTPAQIREGRAGICGHADVSAAYEPGNPKAHWDPGEAFPWERYLEMVSRELAKESEPLVRFTAADELRLGDDVADDGWVPVTLGGVTWLVASAYIAPIGIGEALARAKREGCVLPTPALVDAIWKVADRKVDARKLVRTFPVWDAAHMDAPAVHADQARRVAELVGAEPYRLVAGTYKDVVQLPDGRLGIYGWHRADGTVIQPFYDRHAASWRDYSQGLRLVRRAP